MLEQPPPGPDDLEEMPPPGWRGISKKQFWCWMVALPVACLVLLALGAPLFLRSARPAGRTEAISNAKQVGLALLEFEQDFGSFPSEATVAELVKETGRTLDFSDGSSNAMFRQLIAYGVQTEAIFYCIHPEGAKKPDMRISPGNALAPGEVGFSYVHGMSTKMDPETPLLMGPMDTATADQFHPDVFGYKAVVLSVDNSAQALLLRSDNRAPVGGGVSVLDPSRPCFGGKAPDVRHPKF